MIKKLIKTYKIQITLAAIAVIAIVCAAAWLTHTVRRSSISITTDKRIDITPEIIEKIEAIGEWEFLTVADEELIDTTRNGIFTGGRLARIYYGTMRIGINMKNLPDGWLTVSGDTANLTLPAPRLLDNRFIDEARTRSFYESGRWTAADREEMYRRAHAAMLTKGLTPDNLRTAQNNADTQLRQMMQAMGFNTVIVKFEK